MRHAESVTAAPPESGMRVPPNPINNGHNVADGVQTLYGGNVQIHS